MPPVNILPRDENVWLLVAEAVRIEPGGKISLFGFYGSEKIQIDASASFPKPLALSFIFLLKEGNGAFEATFRISDPAGRVVHSEALATAHKPSPAENHGIAVTMSPFVVSAFGSYRLTLTLDGKRYKRTFIVEADPATPAITTH